ncbi:hypothetical protein SAMN05421538_10264 [Paracoccus isoporae]|uniref:Histidine kinase n=1 Tax=Paracoccus isoporae TaxID=591205 RepID=A0A1G6W846_9RHOB|nr:DUF6446 family protein [Paracoccus isoporae]SDD61978.1 hypothetical protein SAMN05421538_10264 [Paracoccus isoporae]
MTITAGKLMAGTLVLCGIGAGIGVWYTQNYAYYDRIDTPPELSVQTADGAVPLAVGDFQGITSDSSPLRFRACLTVDPGAFAGAEPYAAPTPLNPPGWFDCFDNAALTHDVEDGRAASYLMERDISPGFDRVIAVYPDGRAYIWHQANETAEESRTLE